MSTLEARIAEDLAGHQLVGISLHEDAHCTGPGCGWTPTSSFLFPTAGHRAHVAQMLAPVIREAQAEAWQEGYIKSCFDHGDGGKLHGADNINPYRSNDE